MDLFKLRRKQEIGEKAKNLLENELLKDWWENAEKTLWVRFKNAEPNSKEIDYLKASIDALEGMKADFKRYVAEGKNAAEQTKRGK